MTVGALRVTVVALRLTVVAQWAKAPGIHCYVAGTIPAVTPRYCTKKIEKCSLEHKKTKEKKVWLFDPKKGGGEGARLGIHAYGRGSTLG